MKKSIHKALTATFLLAFILLPTIMFAPPIPPGPGGSTPITPIDSGIWFLVLAGVSYGVYRFLNFKKQLA